MGYFYVNLSVKGASQAELAAFLRQSRSDAFIGPVENGWCSFTDSVIEQQDQEVIDQIGSALSLKFDAVVSVLNHDDDILSVDVFRHGKSVANYNSCPGCFMDDPTDDDLKPQLSSSSAFADLADGLSATSVEEILLASDLFGIELHQRFAKLIGLPSYSVGFGEKYASGGELAGDPGSYIHLTY